MMVEKLDELKSLLGRDQVIAEQSAGIERLAAEREQFRIALLGCLTAARIGLRDIDEYRFDNDKLTQAKSALRYIEREAKIAEHKKEADAEDGD